MARLDYSGIEPNPGFWVIDHVSINPNHTHPYDSEFELTARESSTTSFELEVFFPTDVRRGRIGHHLDGKIHFDLWRWTAGDGKIVPERLEFPLIWDPPANMELLRAMDVQLRMVKLLDGISLTDGVINVIIHHAGELFKSLARQQAINVDPEMRYFHYETPFYGSADGASAPNREEVAVAANTE